MRVSSETFVTIYNMEYRTKNTKRINKTGDDENMDKELIIKYDSKRQIIKKTTNSFGDVMIVITNKYRTCKSCGADVDIKNWGGKILNREYSKRDSCVIWREDQKDFVCNVCLNPNVRRTLRKLGLTNRK